MKKSLMCCLTVFVCAGLFAQQQLPVVAVAPFNVIANAVTAEKADEINELFFLKLGNTRKVRLVNRNIVDRVLTEHRFQAGDWSDDEQKTAELAKALNADWIVQGSIRKSGVNLLIIVQFYDIRTFRFEGGNEIRFPATEDPYDKLNPLVNNLIQTIVGPGSGGQGRQRRKLVMPAIFDDYTIYNGLTMFGYSFTFYPDFMSGISLGVFGVYATYSVLSPDFGGYGKWDSGSGPDFNTVPYTKQIYERNAWVLGYNITIIPNTLYLPLGAGMESVKEWRLQNGAWSSASDSDSSTLLEAGLLFRIKTRKNFAPCIFGTYRNIGFSKHSFTIGVGGCWDFLANK